MSTQAAHTPRVAHTPHAYGIVFAGAGQPVESGQEAQHEHFARVRGKRANSFAERPAPNADCLIARGARESIQRDHLERHDPAGVTDERAKALARVRAPHFDARADWPRRA